MIYTENDIKTNPLFGSLMAEINALHDECGCPEMPSGPSTECAGYDSTYGSAFTPDSIGDWDGREDDIAEEAQRQLESLLDSLDAGKYRNYYAGSEQWEDFRRQAMEIIDDDLMYGNAYTRMCDNPEMVGC